MVQNKVPEDDIKSLNFQELWSCEKRSPHPPFPKREPCLWVWFPLTPLTHRGLLAPHGDLCWADIKYLFTEGPLLRW